MSFSFLERQEMLAVNRAILKVLGELNYMFKKHNNVDISDWKDPLLEVDLEMDEIRIRNGKKRKIQPIMIENTFDENRSPEENLISPTLVSDKEAKVLIHGQVKPIMLDYMVYGFGFLNTPEDIQSYLTRIGSWLAEKGVKDEGKIYKFSNFVYRRCKQYNIEPILMLAKIQHEQSALYLKKPPSQRTLVKIVGMGVTENKDPKLREKYKGFAKQLSSMAFQFYYYLRATKYKKFTRDLRDMYMYDTKKDYKPKGPAEAACLLYTPRFKELKVLKDIWFKIYNECKEYGLINEKTINPIWTKDE